MTTNLVQEDELGLPHFLHYSEQCMHKNLNLWIMDCVIPNFHCRVSYNLEKNKTKEFGMKLVQCVQEGGWQFFSDSVVGLELTPFCTNEQV